MKRNIKELDFLLGRKLLNKYHEKADKSPHGNKRLLTRPNNDTINIHINMYLQFDEEYKLVDISGDKCYSCSRGLYNRSAKVFDREFSKKDIQYLKKYIISITE